MDSGIAESLKNLSLKRTPFPLTEFLRFFIKGYTGSKNSWAKGNSYHAFLQLIEFLGPISWDTRIPAEFRDPPTFVNWNLYWNLVQYFKIPRQNIYYSLLEISYGHEIAESILQRHLASELLSPKV